MKLPGRPTDFLYAQVDPDGGTIGDSDVTLDLATGEGARFSGITIVSGRWIDAVSVACTDPDRAKLSQLQGGDWIRITDVTGDTVTMTRTDTARAINAGEYLFVSLSSHDWGFVLDKVDLIEEFLAKTRSNVEGVLMWGADGAPDDGLVEETDPQAMAVYVNAGVGIVDGEITRIEATTLTGIEAPVGSTRVDLVQVTRGTVGEDDEVAVKTGTEGAGAPAADSDAIVLAELTITVAMSEISDADITDTRTRC